MLAGLSLMRNPALRQRDRDRGGGGRGLCTACVLPAAAVPRHRPRATTPSRPAEIMLLSGLPGLPDDADPAEVWLGQGGLPDPGWSRGCMLFFLSCMLDIYADRAKRRPRLSVWSQLIRGGRRRLLAMMPAQPGLDGGRLSREESGDAAGLLQHGPQRWAARSGLAIIGHHHRPALGPSYHTATIRESVTANSLIVPGTASRSTRANWFSHTGSDLAYSQMRARLGQLRPSRSTCAGDREWTYSETFYLLGLALDRLRAAGPVCCARRRASAPPLVLVRATDGTMKVLDEVPP